MTKEEQRRIFWDNLSLLADLLDLSGKDIARKLRLTQPPFYNHIDLMEDGDSITAEMYEFPFQPAPDNKLIRYALSLAPMLTRSHLLNRPYCTSELTGKLLGYRKRGTVQNKEAVDGMTPFANILSANAGRILIDLKVMGIHPKTLGLSRKSLILMQEEKLMLPKRSKIISIAKALGIDRYYRLYLEDMRKDIIPLLEKKLKALGLLDDAVLSMKVYAAEIVNMKDDLKERFEKELAQGYPDTATREINELRSLIEEAASHITALPYSSQP